MPADVLGRDVEMAAVDDFLRALSSAARAFVITGAPGVGKTTLLDAAVGRARDRGMSVLMTRPAPSDTPLAFAGLDDMLGPVLGTVAGELPKAQRRALGAALLVGDE